MLNLANILLCKIFPLFLHDRLFWQPQSQWQNMHSYALIVTDSVFRNRWQKIDSPKIDCPRVDSNVIQGLHFTFCQ